MSKESPLASIVTPSLSAGRYIEQAMMSIRGQTNHRLEHIIMDGVLRSIFCVELRVVWVRERSVSGLCRSLICPLRQRLVQ